MKKFAFIICSIVFTLNSLYSWGNTKVNGTNTLVLTNNINSSRACSLDTIIFKAPSNLSNYSIQALANGTTYTSTTSGLTIFGFNLTGSFNLDVQASATSIDGVTTLNYNASFLINALTISSFNYAKPEFCSNEGVIFPFSSNLLTGGWYSSTSLGLSINTLTGSINLAASSGSSSTYTVKYTLPAIRGCQQVATTTSVMVTSYISPQLGYGTNQFCQNYDPFSPTLMTPNTGTFTGTAGLLFDKNSGIITFSGSKLGASKITYTIPQNRVCPSASIDFPFTITSPPSIPTFTYDSVNCNVGTLLPNGSFSKGSFIANDIGIVFNDILTGEINLAASRANNSKSYLVTYDIPPMNGCNAFSGLSNPFKILRARTTIIMSEASKQILCTNSANPSILLLPGFTGDAVWQQRIPSQSNWTKAVGSVSGNSLIVPTNQLLDSTYFRVSLYTYINGVVCNDSNFTNSIRLRVIQAPSTSVSYASNSYCTWAFNTFPNNLKPLGGTFTGTAGLLLNNNSGEITFSSSKLGVSNITYTAPSNGICPPTIANYVITISGSLSGDCLNSGTPSVTSLLSSFSLNNTNNSISITIVGNNFTNNTIATVGGVVLSQITNVSSNLLIGIIPAGSVVINPSNPVVIVQNSGGSSSTYTNISVVITDILDNTSSILTQIFPNPNFGSFTISSNSIHDYQIYSLEGTLLQKGILTEGENTITTKLGSGFYFIRVGNITKKLLVE